MSRFGVGVGVGVEVGVGRDVCDLVFGLVC